MFFIYITTNKRNGTLYTGHTDELGRRINEHKGKADNGFLAKHGCDKLVWFETHEERQGAFVRERQIKKWERRRKLEAIETLNPFGSICTMILHMTMCMPIQDDMRMRNIKLCGQSF